VTLWRRYNQEHKIDAVFVAEKMGERRSHLQALSFLECEGFAVNFERCRPFKNEKELSRFRVIMQAFGLAGRYSFLNNAEVVLVNKVPSVAALTPRIVFSIPGADRGHHISISMEESNTERERATGRKKKDSPHTSTRDQHCVRSSAK
jgi:hypothetical protein